MKRKTIFLFVLILAVIFSFIFLQGCSHLKETLPNPWEQVEYNINNGWTLHSMVFDFSNFKIYFAFAPGYAADEGTFYTFNLNDTSITAN